MKKNEFESEIEKEVFAKVVGLDKKYVLTDWESLDIAVRLTQLEQREGLDEVIASAVNNVIANAFPKVASKSFDA